MKNPSVLFVCTANICRSPMAAEIFRLLLQENQADWENWRIESAGTWAQDGQNVSEGTREVMLRRGVDISRHRSRTVSEALLSSFDLILTMEPGHKEALLIEFPKLADRIFMVSEMQGLSVPVRDPYGKPPAAYEVTAETLERMLSKGMGRIVSMVQARQLKRN